MSTTPGGTVTSATAGVTAKAEVTKKNTHRFSPRLMDQAHKLYEQGFTYAAIDVASGAVVQGFTNETDCQKFCEERNAQ